MRDSVLIIGNFLSAYGGSRGVCEELEVRLAGIGWEVFSASRRRHKLLRLADMLLATVRHRQHYSVAEVAVFSGPAFFWAEAVCWSLRRLRKPFILTLHGGNLPQFAARRPHRVARLLGSASIVTAPSDYLKQAMDPYRRDIIVVPNALDLHRYPFRERKPANPNLIWLRAFHEIYNPVMAVRVLAALAPRFPDVQLTMVGPDKGDGSFQKTMREAAARSVSGRIRFTGPVPKDKVPAVLGESDIFLNTTNIDNTPVSVTEAMACGLDVVTTRVGGTPYLVNHERDGLLVGPGDADGMAQAVGRLVEDVELAGACSRNAREKVKAWDWSIVLQKWDDLLRSTIKQGV